MTSNNGYYACVMCKGLGKFVDLVATNPDRHVITDCSFCGGTGLTKDDGIMVKYGNAPWKMLRDDEGISLSHWGIHHV